MFYHQNLPYVKKLCDENSTPLNVAQKSTRYVYTFVVQSVFYFVKPTVNVPPPVAAKLWGNQL